MAQIGLQGACVVASVGQCVTARMAQHVRMNDEVEACTLADPLNQPIKHWP
jgi:hypothetical protein